MESAWSNGKPAYRCRHGRTTATPPGPQLPKNAYVREDAITAHLPALHLVLTSAEDSEDIGGRRRRRRVQHLLP